MSTDMFLHLDKIEGESGDVKHAKDIEITGWSAGYEQPISPAKTATGPTVERCIAEPISITKSVDAASNDLLMAIWSGKVILNGFIVCYRADAAGTKPVEYLRIEMDHIVVTTFGISGGEGEIPQEEVGLSVGKVAFIYKTQKKEGGEDGQKTANFNFIAGTYGGDN
ncbi:MAG: type VI secretion system tube protein Hcp [Desulfobacterales bacterium]|nr:type VI secretion system tube protein Hcp [Desulfobacterales bacterium]